MPKTTTKSLTLTFSYAARLGVLNRNDNKKPPFFSLCHQVFQASSRTLSEKFWGARRAVIVYQEWWKKLFNRQNFFFRLEILPLEIFSPLLVPCNGSLEAKWQVTAAGCNSNCSRTISHVYCLLKTSRKVRWESVWLKSFERSIRMLDSVAQS